VNNMENKEEKKYFCVQCGKPYYVRKDGIEATCVHKWGIDRCPQCGDPISFSDNIVSMGKEDKSIMCVDGSGMHNHIDGCIIIGPTSKYYDEVKKIIGVVE